MRNYFYFVVALVLGFAVTSSFSSRSSHNEESVELNVNNTVLLRGPVSEESVSKTMLELARLTALRGSESYPIYLVLDSPGGSVMDGEILINYLINVPNIHSVTIFSASMAEHIAQSVTGKRYVTQSGTFMDHRASGVFKGQFGNGEVEARLEWIKSIIKIISERTAKRIGISLEDYNHKIINEWWNAGANAIDSGHADAIINLTCSQELIDSRVVVSTLTIIGLETTTFSGCPLFANPILQ